MEGFKISLRLFAMGLFLVPALGAVPPNWKSKGCFVDNSPDRLLGTSYDLLDKTTMTWAYCTRLCEDGKFKYAGLEDGYTCCISPPLTTLKMR